MEDPGVWISIAFRIIATCLYMYHFFVVAGQYRREGGSRLHRYMVVSMVLVIGMIGLSLGGLVLVWPEILGVARGFGVIASSVVLIGSVYIFFSHKLYPR